MTINTSRMEAFSDCVISIVITIMVLEIKTPDINKDITSKQVLKHLAVISPYLIAYLFSFMMIGIFWFNHHHLFVLMNKSTDSFFWLNLMFLFFMSFIPYATIIVGYTPQVPVSPAIYGLVMFVSSGLLTYMRQYAIRHNLLLTHNERAVSREVKAVSVKGRNKGLIGSVIYLLSVPLAFVSVYAAYACFLIPPAIFFIPEGIQDEKMAEKIEYK